MSLQYLDKTEINKATLTEVISGKLGTVRIENYPLKRVPVHTTKKSDVRVNGYAVIFCRGGGFLS